MYSGGFSFSGAVSTGAAGGAAGAFACAAFFGLFGGRRGNLAFQHGFLFGLRHRRCTRRTRWPRLARLTLWARFAFGLLAWLLRLCCGYGRYRLFPPPPAGGGPPPP